jgi:plastocyanin
VTRQRLIKKDSFMSQLRDSLCAFAAGAVVSCVVYVATALPAETRASIDNFMFKPDTITVPIGTTVAWQNDDEIPHTVTSVDGTFHSTALDTKDKFSFTFDKAGTFEYFCRLHPYMKGKIVVAS